MEAFPLERRLTAIPAADVDGYSRLMHGDEEATMATLTPVALSLTVIEASCCTDQLG